MCARLVRRALCMHTGGTCASLRCLREGRTASWPPSQQNHDKNTRPQAQEILGDEVKVLKVDTDKNPELSSMLKVGGSSTGCGCAGEGAALPVQLVGL